MKLPLSNHVHLTPETCLTSDYNYTLIYSYRYIYVFTFSTGRVTEIHSVNSVTAQMGSLTVEFCHAHKYSVQVK